MGIATEEERRRRRIAMAIARHAAVNRIPRHACECGKRFFEKSEFFKHKHHCKLVDVPDPQLQLFGGGG